MLRSKRSSPAMVRSSGPPSSGAFNSRGQRIVPSVPSESPVKAYLRVRPAAGAERRARPVYTLLDDYTVRFKPDARLFEFDRVFSPKTHQETVYRDSMNPLLKPLLVAENSFYIAYGGSQTGKSYSLEGTRFRQPTVGTTRVPSNPRGCVGRFLKDLFVEIRNKQTYDSYTKKHVKQKLDVHSKSNRVRNFSKQMLNV